MREYKTELVYEGEGLEGDYDPTDNEDRPLLRYTVYYTDDNACTWQQVDEASWCTEISEGVFTNKALAEMEHRITKIAYDLTGYIESGSGYHKRFEELASLDDNDMIQLSIELWKKDLENIEGELNFLFFLAAHVDFKGEPVNDFNQKLFKLVKDYGERILKPLQERIQSLSEPETHLAEVIMWIPEIIDPDTYYFRLQMAIDALESSAPVIRNAAISALDYFDDTKAIPALQALLNEETSEDVRQKIEKVLVDLGEIANLRNINNKVNKRELD